MIAELADAWYHAQVQIKETTRSGYRYNLDRHVLPTWGVYLLTAVHSAVPSWLSVLE